MEEDLTNWRDGSTNPELVGVYEKDVSSLGLYTTLRPASSQRHALKWSFWNGDYWCGLAHTPELATFERGVSGYQYVPWRGLAKDPSTC